MYWERSDIKSADLGRKHNEKPHKPFHCVSNAILFFNWNAGPTHWQCLIFSRHSGKRYPPFISVPFLPANYNFDLALIAKKFNKWGGGNPLEKKIRLPCGFFRPRPLGSIWRNRRKRYKWCQGFCRRCIWRTIHLLQSLVERRDAIWKDFEIRHQTALFKRR